MVIFQKILYLSQDTLKGNKFITSKALLVVTTILPGHEKGREIFIRDLFIQLGVL